MEKTHKKTHLVNPRLTVSLSKVLTERLCLYTTIIFSTVIWVAVVVVWHLLILPKIPKVIARYIDSTRFSRKARRA